LALRSILWIGNPPMAKKVYTVIVTLPELAAAHAEYVIKVESSNWSQAVKLACEEISQRPHVRGKHIKSAKISFTAVAGKAEAEGEGVAPVRDEDVGNQGRLFEF
jgi:hypothetical protein